MIIKRKWCTRCPSSIIYVLSSCFTKALSIINPHYILKSKCMCREDFNKSICQCKSKMKIAVSIPAWIGRRFVLSKSFGFMFDKRKELSKTTNTTDHVTVKFKWFISCDWSQNRHLNWKVKTQRSKHWKIFAWLVLKKWLHNMQFILSTFVVTKDFLIAPSTTLCNNRHSDFVKNERIFSPAR